MEEGRRGRMEEGRRGKGGEVKSEGRKWKVGR